ncbi:D-alanyl-D-alanine carboxypeptidase family protein [Nakamurella flava]|uniref:D-alanyl-D-alanine carboxypeptidase family protein n=1 Tax=Nakamurella flava TaxID=2576308 RepID=UPI00197BA3AF|nr:D-alanyl-D-alanine carboxypeptidase family protein [Nakamurella flava]
MAAHGVRVVAVIGTAVSLAVGPALLGAPIAGAAPNTDPFSPPSVTVQTPSTDGCPQQQKPPPAVDTSEDSPPGQTAPEPLPVPAQPVGGGQLGSCGFALPPDAPPLPSDISAGAWLIADLDTGEVLAAKDPHGRYRPASTLKLLTAQVMLKNLANLDQVVEGTQADTAQDGTRVGIEAGGKYTVRDLISYLVMISGNDAANALARTNGGYDKTIADMNATARALGALDTRAATPSGLDGPGQSTSAYDLALFARADMNTPPFPELISRPDIRVPGADGGEGYIAANDNQILAQYPGGLGGKTGFTDDAGNTFVGMAAQNGRRLVVTMMNGTQQPRRQWMQAASLLDWGFALPAGTPGVGELVTSLAEATGGVTPTPTIPASASGATESSAASSAAEPTPSPAAAQQPTTTGLSTSVLVLLLIAVLVVVVGVLLLLRRRHLNQRATFAGDATPDAADAHLAEGGAASTPVTTETGTQPTVIVPAETPPSADPGDSADTPPTAPGSVAEQTGPDDDGPTGRTDKPDTTS